MKETGEKIQVGVSAAMVRARKAGLPVLSITSDLPGSTGVAGFRKEFPEASYDVGVAESNMISVAGGLSKLGYIPVVDTFAQFGVTKGALPLTMGSLSEAPIIAILSHTGFQDAADGASHQALGYMAMVSSIPHVSVYNLSCSDEADALITQTIEIFAEQRKNGKIPNSSIFFLGRENFPKTFDSGFQYDLKKAQVVMDTSSAYSSCITIATTGSLVGQALLAAEELKNKNKGAIVVHFANVNDPDITPLKRALEKSSGQLVTVEDHQMIGGFGQMLCHSALLKGIDFKVKSLAVHGEFGQSAYMATELYRKHRIDAAAVVEAALSFH